MDNGLSFMKNGTPTDTCNKIQACIHHYVYFDFDYHNCPYCSPPLNKMYVRNLLSINFSGNISEINFLPEDYSIALWKGQALMGFLLIFDGVHY